MKRPHPSSEQGRDWRSRAAVQLDDTAQCWDCQASAQDQMNLRLHVTPSLDSVKVNTGCEIGGVELDVVGAGVDVGVHNLCDLLADSVVKCDEHDIRAGVIEELKAQRSYERSGSPLKNLLHNHILQLIPNFHNHLLNTCGRYLYRLPNPRLISSV
jgi:hypothetical protein